MGNTREDHFLYLPLDEEYKCKKGEQLVFVPVSLTKQGTVLPLEYHGSAHIHAYVKATGIMEIPKNISIINKGEIVCVRPL